MASRTEREQYERGDREGGSDREDERDVVYER
jgi:hypothetical protein